MKKTLFLLMIGLFVGAEVAEAQRRGDRPTREELRQRLGARAAPAPEVGLRGAYDFDTRNFGVGAQAQIPLGRRLRLAPSGEVYFGDETTWQANADVALSLLFLRAGGGLAVVDGARVGDPEDSPELGLNLFAGIQSPSWRRARIRPFAEARWTFLDESTPFRVAAGVNVPLGGARR